MTSTTAAVSRKCTSASSTSRCRPNARRARKLGAKSRRTNCSNIFRWYRASFGRYTQTDPLDADPLRSRLLPRPPSFGDVVVATAIHDPQGLSRLKPDEVAGGSEPYAYGSDAPLRFVDPLGLYPCVVESISSKSDYEQDIEGPPGKTFLGCQYIGVCGPASGPQYLVHYQRGAPYGCPCKPVCIFSIDLAKGVKNGRARCID